MLESHLTQRWVWLRRAGVGCSGRDGGGDFIGSQACCGSGVRSLGRVCSAKVGAPCLVEEEETEEFTCSGDAGILQGDVCCEVRNYFCAKRLSLSRLTKLM